MRILTTLFISMLVLPLSAQFLVQGRVIDGISGKSVDFATVIVKDKQTQDVIAGTTTQNGGLFEIETDSENSHI
jgi:hypothetical protein